MFVLVLLVQTVAIKWAIRLVESQAQLLLDGRKVLGFTNDTEMCLAHRMHLWLLMLLK